MKLNRLIAYFFSIPTCFSVVMIPVVVAIDAVTTSQTAFAQSFQPLNNFVNKWAGGRYDGDGFPRGAEFQCTDLTNFFITQFGGRAAAYPEGAARNAFSDSWARAVGGTLIRNSTTDPNSFPQPGDIVVWNSRMGGGFGHVAIADVGSNFNTLRVIEQNGGGGTGKGTGSDAIRRMTYANYANVIGWVRISTVNQRVR